MVDGSTWGGAGRRFLRMIFLTLRSVGAATSWDVVVRAVEICSESSSGCAVVGASGSCTSVIVYVYDECDVVFMVCCVMKLEELSR